MKESEDQRSRSVVDEEILLKPLAIDPIGPEPSPWISARRTSARCLGGTEEMIPAAASGSGLIRLISWRRRTFSWPTRLHDPVVSKNRLCAFEQSAVSS